MNVHLFKTELLPPSCRRAALFRRGCALALGKKAASSRELNLIFGTNPQIRRVNKKFLSHDYDTDVIAFPYGQEPPAPKGVKLPGQEPEPFGDVYISVDQARLQAKELGHTLLEELLTLAVHGTLHLMGYDDHAPRDRKSMFARQDRIVRQVLS